jgi:hypothetical protein
LAIGDLKAKVNLVCMAMQGLRGWPVPLTPLLIEEEFGPRLLE